jgi:hypothetical protein
MVISAAGTSDVAQPSGNVMRNFGQRRPCFGPRRWWRLRMDRRRRQRQEK